MTDHPYRGLILQNYRDLHLEDIQKLYKVLQHYEGCILNHGFMYSSVNEAFHIIYKSMNTSEGAMGNFIVKENMIRELQSKTKTDIKIKSVTFDISNESEIDLLRFVPLNTKTILESLQRKTRFIYPLQAENVVKLGNSSTSVNNLMTKLSQIQYDCHKRFYEYCPKHVESVIFCMKNLFKMSGHQRRIHHFCLDLLKQCHCRQQNLILVTAHLNFPETLGRNPNEIELENTSELLLQEQVTDTKIDYYKQNPEEVRTVIYLHVYVSSLFFKYKNFHKALGHAEVAIFSLMTMKRKLGFDSDNGNLLASLERFKVHLLNIIDLGGIKLNENEQTVLGDIIEILDEERMLVAPVGRKAIIVNIKVIEVVGADKESSLLTLKDVIPEMHSASITYKGNNIVQIHLICHENVNTLEIVQDVSEESTFDDTEDDEVFLAKQSTTVDDVSSDEESEVETESNEMNLNSIERYGILDHAKKYFLEPTYILNSQQFTCKEDEWVYCVFLSFYQSLEVENILMNNLNDILKKNELTVKRILQLYAEDQRGFKKVLENNTPEAEAKRWKIIFKKLFDMFSLDEIFQQMPEPAKFLPVVNETKDDLDGHKYKKKVEIVDVESESESEEEVQDNLTDREEAVLEKILSSVKKFMTKKQLLLEKQIKSLEKRTTLINHMFNIRDQLSDGWGDDNASKNHNLLKTFKILQNLHQESLKSGVLSGVEHEAVESYLQLFASFYRNDFTLRCEYGNALLKKEAEDLLQYYFKQKI